MRINTTQTAQSEPILQNVGGRQQKNGKGDVDTEFQDMIGQILSMMYMLPGGQQESSLGTAPFSMDPATIDAVGGDMGATPVSGSAIARFLTEMSASESMASGGEAAADAGSLLQSAMDAAMGESSGNTAQEGLAGITKDTTLLGGTGTAEGGRVSGEVSTAENAKASGDAGRKDGVSNNSAGNPSALAGISLPQTEEMLSASDDDGNIPAGDGSGKQSDASVALGTDSGKATAQEAQVAASKNIITENGVPVTGAANAPASMNAEPNGGSRISFASVGSTQRETDGKEAGSSLSGQTADEGAAGKAASADKTQGDSLFSGTTEVQKESGRTQQTEGGQAGNLSGHEKEDSVADAGRSDAGKQEKEEGIDVPVFQSRMLSFGRTGEGSQASAKPVSIENLQDIAAQMAEKITMNRDGDHSSVKVQLRPKELGEIEIMVSMKGGRLSGEILVENITAREALESQLPSLKDRLKEQNVMLHDVNISLQQNDAGQGREGQNRFYREDGQAWKHFGQAVREEEPVNRQMAFQPSGHAYRSWDTGNSLDRLA